MKTQTKTIILSTYLMSSFFVCANASSSIQVLHTTSGSISSQSQQIIKKARNDRKLSYQTLKALVNTSNKNRPSFFPTHILHKTKTASSAIQAR